MRQHAALRRATTYAQSLKKVEKQTINKKYNAQHNFNVDLLVIGYGYIGLYIGSGL